VETTLMDELRQGAERGGMFRFCLLVVRKCISCNISSRPSDSSRSVHLSSEACVVKTVEIVLVDSTPKIRPHEPLQLLHLHVIFISMR
jgi:hypothetical protein